MKAPASLVESDRKMDTTPLHERETIINVPNSGEVMVWTNVQKHITAFRKKANQPNSKVREVRCNTNPNVTDWAEFRIDEKDYNPASGVKRTMNLSDEERQLRAARLRS